MSWGISPNATEKEKIFADFNDSLNGMNRLSYRHHSQIYDIGRELADKEYQQGKADAIEEYKNLIIKNLNTLTLGNKTQAEYIRIHIEEWAEEMKEGAE